MFLVPVPTEATELMPLAGPGCGMIKEGIKFPTGLPLAGAGARAEDWVITTVTASGSCQVSHLEAPQAGPALA